MSCQSTFHLHEALERVRTWLPTQGPIQNFVHHNTLHAFEGQRFEEAILEAASLFGARAYLPLEEYRQFKEAGKISENLLGDEIVHLLGEELCEQRFFQDMFSGKELVQEALIRFGEKKEPKKEPEREIAKKILPLLEEIPNSRNSPRARLMEEKGIDLNQTVHPVLIRLIGSYLDQGVSFGSFPQGHGGFYSSVVQLIRQSIFPVARYVKASEVEKYFSLSAEEMVGQHLDSLCNQSSEKEDYLRETLLALPGWSGLVSELENEPKNLAEPRAIRLIEFVAVKLLLELQSISHSTPQNRQSNLHSKRLKNALGSDQKKDLKTQDQARAIAGFLLSCGIRRDSVWRACEEELPLGKLFGFLNECSLARIYHRAMEKTVYQSALSGIHANAQRNAWLKNSASSSFGSPSGSSFGAPLVTAVFCIDDREASVRRYLEEENPECATESTAGFFGVDFLFQSLHDATPVKLCPLPVKPKHIVVERPRHGKRKPFGRRVFGKISALWGDFSTSAFLGGFVITLSSPFLLFHLILKVFKPTFFSKISSHHPVQIDSDLQFIRFSEENLGLADSRSAYFHSTHLHSADLHSDYLAGYSFEEMADRVSGQLRSTGMITKMGPLVLLIAHGSSSVNNPHFAAYDCGACSGRPGAANAKTFARMANHPQVREILRSRGIDIPNSTIFMGAFHDTCQDIVLFFDEHLLHQSHQSLLARFKKTFQIALRRNAKERIRRFENISLSFDEKRAHQEVKHRSLALFEPRPELNHATNALCVIGRRYLTKRLFLDRRAFLQSYDPSVDREGELLTGILSAVIPVCAGINLEYFFSRMDNEVYGSGTKLPHNVASLLGVMNGVDGDLRTGLPRQMIEVHDPVRCLFVIEQTREEVLKILLSNASLARWFDHEWAFLAVIDPNDSSIFEYLPGKGFRAVATLEGGLTRISSIRDYVSKSRENLAFALMEP